MKSKVYYGEYSLRHWIDLLLSGNITLPEYQRSFVWGINAVEDFIESLKNREFIPPVIIGNFGNECNYIIDGQQRLTSLLLAYIGKMPRREEFKMKDIVQYADTDDSIPDDDLSDDPIEWQFSLLLHKDSKNTRESIHNEINFKWKEKYENLNVDISEILDDVFLGFSFIVPQEEKSLQQKFYCSVFRNINRKGTALLPQESRRSLYFLDTEKKNFFDWNGLKQCKITNNNKTRPIDFIRYVSIVSQYAKDENLGNVMRLYSPRGGKDEEYFAEYISEAIGDKPVKMFKSFTEIFPESKFQDRLDTFSKNLKDLDLEKSYNSIIETDITFFGLIYFLLIKQAKIRIVRKKDLEKAISGKLAEYKDISNDENRKQEKNPNTLKYIRKRLSDSIELYKGFVLEE